MQQLKSSAQQFYNPKSQPISRSNSNPFRSPMNRREFLSLSTITVAGTLLQARPSISGERKSKRVDDQTIQSLRIYPAIGLARVGGSTKSFLSPEIPGIPPHDNDNYKEGNSLIKKQVQRFRIYAFYKDNQVIKEITGEDAEIEWSVHLANSKASWYEFHNPLDNGDLAPGIPGAKRNPEIQGNQEREKQLIVDGGEVSINGINTNLAGGESKYQAQGVFQSKTKVFLGELRTDEKGRLLVYPGDGKSLSPSGAKITSFADNADWIDDWCDGPVKATVRLKNSSLALKADSAWVACAGPNFAPEIPPIVTLKDVIENLNVQNGWESKPQLVSFRQDIYPILRRLDLMKWVTQAALLRSAWIDLGPLSDPVYLKKLASKNNKFQKLRQSIFSKIRQPVNSEQSSQKMASDGNAKQLPWMLGDGVNYKDSPLFMLRITDLQAQKLKQWADGNFVEDYLDEEDEIISSFEDIPLDQQPQALTDAVLESCSGGGFHPGVELTYNLRHSTLYQKYYNSKIEPYRIALGNRSSLIQDLGPELTPKILLTTNLTESPIGKQMPGDLTRWMGIPWQCDAFSCQSVDFEEDFPTATWWPALLPIDVLPEEFYLRAIDTSLSEDERVMYANQRVRWSRSVAGVGYHANQSYWDGLENIITLWQRLGFVIRKPPAAKDQSKKLNPVLTGDFFVEVSRGQMDMMSPYDRRNQEES
jgi:hypothetical protein